jgi:hypothetical protein
VKRSAKTKAAAERALEKALVDRQAPMKQSEITPKVSMTQDRYLGRRLTDRQTAEVLEGLFGAPTDEKGPKSVPGS